MFIHTLGNETKLAESVQSGYRRSADGFRLIKALKTRIQRPAKTQPIIESAKTGKARGRKPAINIG